MFIIILFKSHYVTSQGYNLSMRIIFSNKSIFAFNQRINTIFSQRLQPIFSFSSQRKRKQFQFNNIPIYIFILLHLTKFNKIIKMGSSIFSTSTRKLLSHDKI